MRRLLLASMLVTACFSEDATLGLDCDGDADCGADQVCGSGSCVIAGDDVSETTGMTQPDADCSVEGEAACSMDRAEYLVCTAGRWEATACDDVCQADAIPRPAGACVIENESPTCACADAVELGCRSEAPTCDPEGIRYCTDDVSLVVLCATTCSEQGFSEGTACAELPDPACACADAIGSACTEEGHMTCAGSSDLATCIDGEEHLRNCALECERQGQGPGTCVPGTPPACACT